MPSSTRGPRIDAEPASSHSPTAHALRHTRRSPKHQVEVVAEDGQEAHVDDGATDEQLEPLDDPLAAVVLVPLGQGIDSQEKCLAYCSAAAMVDPRLSLPYDLFARARWHVGAPHSETELGGTTRFLLCRNKHLSRELAVKKFRTRVLPVQTVGVCGFPSVVFRWVSVVFRTLSGTRNDSLACLRLA